MIFYISAVRPSLICLPRKRGQPFPRFLVQAAPLLLQVGKVGSAISPNKTCNTCNFNS